MTTVRALIIYADESRPVVLQEIAPNLETLQQVAGFSSIEAVSPAADTPRSAQGWHAYVDEEGKLRGLPVNERASKLAWLLGWPLGDILVGPAVFLGDGEDGEEAAVPDLLVSAVTEMGCEIREE